MQIVCSCGYEFDVEAEFDYEFDRCVKCPGCHKLQDICPCNKGLVEVDAYGIMLCTKCFDGNTQAQQAVRKGENKEQQMFGY